MLAPMPFILLTKCVVFIYSISSLLSLPIVCHRQSSWGNIISIWLVCMYVVYTSLCFICKQRENLINKKIKKFTDQIINFTAYTYILTSSTAWFQRMGRLINIFLYAHIYVYYPLHACVCFWYRIVEAKLILNEMSSLWNCLSKCWQ